MLPPEALKAASSPVLAVFARGLLTLPFWWSGLSKILDFPGAVAEAAHFGLEPAMLTAVAVISVQLAGSGLVIWGRWAWIGAGALAVFTLSANMIGHAFWTLADPMSRFHDMNAFLANLGLVGGLLLAAALEGGRRRG